MARRLQRFPTTTPGVAFAARAGAIILALVVSGAIISFYGADPLQLGAQVIRSTFGSRFGLQDFGLLVTPLILCGLAVTITLRIGIWNIGAEGQFAMGALATTWVGIFVAGPPPLMLVLLFFIGALGGLSWILLPTLARAYVGVNELITHAAPELRRRARRLLRLHRSLARQGERYDGFYLQGALRRPVDVGDAALRHRCRDRPGSRACRRAHLHPVGLRGAPERGNPDAARYAGIPVRRRIIAVMLISGAIAGLAGMFEIAGTVHRLQGGISNNFGYVGIMVAILGAWLMSRRDCRGGADGRDPERRDRAANQGHHRNTVLALTGLILFLTAIGDELAHYRLVARAAEDGLRRSGDGYSCRHPFGRGARRRGARARRAGRGAVPSASAWSISGWRD